jgi:cytochrome c5
MHEPDQHVSPIKNWKQLVVVVALAFIVPIAVIILLSQIVTDHPVDPGTNDSAVLNRIKPVGNVVLAPAGTTTQAPADAPSGPVVSPVAMAAPAGKPDGKKTYETTCVACHSAGVAGAPKFGDKAAWAPRIKSGIETLYTSALKGKGGMPAKGGNAALPDADIKAAVDYMVAAGK